ncbi:MAG TPA: DUF362 domain-containing protein [Spirochaetota bacterium]|nr:DUF362 domain-containing protein [Spirochaetota bacterium]HQF07771.1 DUF362 domain-containing protein [Spirochaetota bacterium]HQH96824.1 DUF362 domain-containing protein [Spirochaetota bacterium]HQJ70669.1 DUF362 domain-containing protein [Spirochaetota bacterium]
MKQQAQGVRVQVAIAEANYEMMDAAVQTIMSLLGKGPWLKNLKGKQVFLKPNLLGMFPLENGATTNPALVSAMVRLLLDAGAKVTVGDNCGVGGYGLNERVARHTGVFDASLGTYRNVATATKLVKLKSRYLDSLVVSKDMLDADVLINLPKMKTHSLTIVTGAVKNMFGLISGAGKGKSHAAAPAGEDFGRILAEIFSIRPPDFTVMDAVMAMEGNGPSAGKPKHVGRILASDNAVALDAVMCGIMGIRPDLVHHIREASSMGHGPIDRASIDVVGEMPGDLKFRLPVTVSRFRLSRVVNSGFFANLVRSKLVLDKDRCRKCGICNKECPTGAMQMDDYPVIDQTKCIRCLCCQELCPDGAWSLKGLMGRMQGYGV